jgi:hypothetical protein
VQMRAKAQESISNLSMDLIGHALEHIQRGAFPVYKKNIVGRDPPYAHGEFAPSAIAILLITSGLDYHLARLKYLRDLARQKPPLPHTPYFNWEIGDVLHTKIERLLVKRTEKRLKEQILELTIMRDSVAHPKLYFIRQLIRPDYSPTKQTAKLAAGASHRKKALQRKLKRSERTKCLRLPLVPTWISYVDIVVCILVLTRFLNLLEYKYGNPYAWVGGFSVRNDPADFFHGWGDKTRRSISMEEWARAFFDSLAPVDQQKVQKRLGAEAVKYIRKRLSRPKIGKGRIADILRIMQNPPNPEFLRKPPPWPIRP